MPLLNGREPNRRVKQPSHELEGRREAPFLNAADSPRVRVTVPELT
jgi:hypothetical protein